MGNLVNHHSKTIEIYDFDTFDKFCKKFIDNFDTIGYDIETNAHDTHSADYRVVGFSLASSSDIGCYVVLDSIDFTMSDFERTLIESRLRKILLQKKNIVYNCMHELPATLNWLGIEIPNFEDLLIMAKLMMGTATVYPGNGGLKAQSVTHLGIADWSEDLDKYVELVKTKKIDKDTLKDGLNEILSKYYETNELENIINKVLICIENEISKSKEFSYAFIPSKLIARYGSIDSSVLFDLKDFYVKWMKEESQKLGINIFTGYKYWKWHHYAGYVLERNGAYWNEEKAKRIEKWCEEGKLETLKAMISSPLMRKYIEQNAKSEFDIYIYENYCDKIIDTNSYTIKRKYSKSIGVVPNDDESSKVLQRLGLMPNKQGIFKLEMSHIIHFGKDFIKNNPEIYNQWIEKYIDNIINGNKTFDELKKIVNPNSTVTEFKEYVSDMLITPIIRYAKVYDNITRMTEEPDFSLESFINDNKKYIDDCRLVSLVYKLNVSDRTPHERFVEFIKFIKGDVDFNQWKVKRLIKDGLENYKLEKLDAPTFNALYNLYLMCHIDVEDSKTWNREFEWMFNYKMFKKFAKLQSTYVDGTTGRANVYLVDKNSLTNGDVLTKREQHYQKDIKTPENKTYLMQQSFKVNMAETGRWTAGMHNLPASDAIKGIFTSRFYGGCIAMPDGSQMEIRTLAAESQDESLMKAFADGVDIHRFFASKIYSVPYEDVQKWQRGLAKNAVFGMLYGESEQTFANTYLGGDLSKAKEVYDGMFTGFPKIKDYIDRKHNQYSTLKKVTTLTQRFIDLSHSKDSPDRLLRQSQNYPIQATAEDIAGVILYKLIEWLRDNNMKSKPFCFIHDSIEIDMHPDEVFKIIKKLDWLFNIFPREEFGVPVACDVPLSTNMGAEIEVVELNCDEDYNDVEIILNGFEDDIIELLENWKLVYRVVEEEKDFEPSESDKLIYMPIAERFLPQKAPMSMKQGTYRNRIERKYHIIRK